MADPSRAARERSRPEPEIIDDEPKLARTIRVPLGYVLLSAAGAILLLVGAFTFGHLRGQQAERSEYATRVLDPAAEIGSLGTSDPLHQPSSSEIQTRREPERGATKPRTTAPKWGPIESDPRNDGWHYFRLMETRKDGAVRLAEFLRGEGLEAYVVSAHNGRFVVIALPGFPKRDVTSPQFVAMKETINRIGKKWQAVHGGNSDLSDAYLYP